MDAEQLAKALLSEDLTAEKQAELLAAIKMSVAQAKEIRQKKIGENARLVVSALKKIESDITSRYDALGNNITQRVGSIKNGVDGAKGRDGVNGRDGKAGRDGSQGSKGTDGLAGRNGLDGENGVSVTDAHIDFDGSLIISLSSGQVLNVGEVVAPDLAEKIKVITNGGGTSQQVLDTLISLQTQINNIYPSQTGNAGKFLTTNGTNVSWSQVAGGLDYQGTWNASANTPTLASGVGVNGYYYITNTAGSTNLNGITDWQIGDWLLFNGTVWQKIDQSNTVASVNGKVGVVVLNKTDVSLGDVDNTADAAKPVSTAQQTALNLKANLASPTFTGTVVLPSGQALIAPALGTPSSGVMTNVTGTAAGLSIGGNAATATNASTVTTNANLTGAITSVGNATSLGSFTSAQLATALTDETGTGASVFATSPTLVTPALGTPASGVITNLTGTASININGTVGATTPAAASVTALTASADSSFTSTGAVQLSSGTTAERPAGAAGKLRFNNTTTQFEGFNGTAWASVGGAAISNDTATATDVFPLFSNATSGTALTVFTGNARLLYRPSTGELKSSVLNATNGIVINSQTVAVSYEIAAGGNAMSVGPITVALGQTVTVASGSRWVVL